MASVLSAVGTLISSVTTWVTSYLALFFTHGGTGGAVDGVSVIGLFAMVLPLAGLGIGIIRRLVRIRA